MSFFRIKPQEEDATLDKLPHNRREGYFDILRNRFDLILWVGTMNLVCFLPFLLLYGLCLSASASVNASYAAGGIEEGEAVSQLFALSCWRDLFFLPCAWIASLCLAAEERILKRLVYQESIQFWGEVGRGIKEDYLPTAFAMSLLWLFYFIADFVKNLVTPSMNPFGVAVRYLPLAVLVLVVLPTFFYFAASQPIYEEKWGKRLWIGFQLMAKTYWQSFLFGLAFFLPFVSLWFGNLIVDLVFYVLFSLFYLPLFSLAFQSYACSSFDRFINLENFPSLYHKGLFDEKRD